MIALSRREEEEKRSSRSQAPSAHSGAGGGGAATRLSLTPNSKEDSRLAGGDSRISGQSRATNLSRSSKRANAFGFGNSFLAKHGALVKTGLPKVLLRYHQVQINEMCGRMRETQDIIENMRTELLGMRREREQA